MNALLDDPSDTSVRIAIVSFGTDYAIDSNFRGYSEKNQLLNAIDGIPLQVEPLYSLVLGKQRLFWMLALPPIRQW